jgi:serine/threonine protein kinase
MSAQFEPSKRFRILRPLGEGGMGVVYEALDLERNANVALKTLRHLTTDSVVRFKREFRALQDIQHPNLVSLGELFSDGGHWYFSMELVDGADFATYVRPPPAGRPPSLPPELARTEVGDGEENLRAPEMPSVTRLVERRPKYALDEGRLRGALAQLLDGLGALHAAGKVHRDVKPSNIRVTPEGRLVLLDFGLVADLVEGYSLDATVVGTAAYMAPEQAASREVDESADLYSVGVLLFEALTGAPPFSGKPIDVLVAKQTSVPVDVRTLAPEAPASLAELCAELLRFDPRARPTAEEVRRRVTTGTHAEARSVSQPRRSRARLDTTAGQSTMFVGRDAELLALRAAFDESRDRAVIVEIEGESGVGKSTLARTLASAVLDGDPKAVVVFGRCRERESVPYKALDGVIDALAAFMARLPPEEAGALVPMRPALLVQTFPVLKRVGPIARAPQAETVALDPLEQRNRVFSAVRELFTRLTMRRRVVVVVDDLQWADADSLSLLTELVRPPEEPHMLVLATSRPRAPGAAALPAELRVRRMPLGRLTDDEATLLANRLLSRALPEGTIDPRALVEDAGGHPLFIDELVRHVVTFGGRAGHAIHLDDALWERATRLGPKARRIIELLAVAGAPLHMDVLARASETPAAELARTLGELRVANLVRGTSGRATDLVEPYHDRVREAALARIAPEARRLAHERVAIALEGAEVIDAEALAANWTGAGDRARAAVHTERAADNAMSALAFDHAAHLYRACIDLLPGDEQSKRLQARLADALANAGRGAESAEAYQAAAASASDREALFLRQKAAEQLLRAGHMDAGMSEVRRVLDALGMKLPRSPLIALFSFLFLRLVIRLRGLTYRERDESEISPHELSVVDVLWSLSFTLSIVDTIRGSDFQARQLVYALRLGEPYRVARALAMEVGYAVGVAGARWESAEVLHERTLAIARRTGRPHAEGCAYMTAGVATYLDGRFKLSLALSDAAADALRNCTGAWSEMDRSRSFALSSLAMLGGLKELCRRSPLYLREAQERGDHFAATNLRVGHANLAWLVVDDPAGARQAVTDAMTIWTKEGFHIEHYYALLARVQADLYVGDAHAAVAKLDESWGALRRSFLLRIRAVRVQALFLRARALLAVAERDSSARPWKVREVRRLARKLAGEKVPWSVALSLLLSAGACAVDRQDGEALALLARASETAATCDMALHAAVAKRARGLRMGGPLGTSLVAEADAWLAAEGVKSPERFSAMVLPGVGPPK